MQPQTRIKPLDGKLPFIEPLMDPAWPVPTDEQCKEWWDRYGMLSHIREHSLLVALVAGRLAELARRSGMNVSVQAVRSSALLHDIGKTYAIRYGGNHCQIGGSLAQELTGNPSIAQGVLHHVCWPGPLDARRFFLPMAVIYADKRVMHTEIVPLDSRLADILERYGSTESRRVKIMESYRQVQIIQEQLSELIGADLNASAFDSRRLV
jgi:putative nucleotidyltransferase with HDIG domain